MEDVTWQAVQAVETDCASTQKALLPELIYSPVIALAVRKDLQRPLTWAISAAKGTSQWNLADLYARAKFIPPPKCAAILAAKTASRSLDVDTGAGVLYLSLFLTTAGASRPPPIPIPSLYRYRWRALPTTRHAQMHRKLTGNCCRAPRQLSLVCDAGRARKGSAVEGAASYDP